MALHRISIRANPLAERINHWPTTSAYYVVFIIIGIGAALLGPSLPSLAQNTDSLLGDMSMMFSARAVGYLLGALVVGRWYDRGAGHPLMGVMLIVTAIIFSLVPVASAVWILAVLFVCIGISESIVDVGGNTFLAWLHQEKVAPFMNGLHFFFGVGGFLAPLLLAQVLISTGEISWSYWILALLTLPVALWVFFLPTPKPCNIEEIVNKKLTKIEKRMFASIVIFLALFVGVEVSFGGWIYSYGITTGLTDETGAAYLTSVFWAAFTMARLISIPLAIRIKPIYQLFCSTLGCIASLGFILLFPNSLFVLTASTVGVGVFIATVFPTTFSFCEIRLGITGKLSSWFFVGASVGVMSIPWLFGQFLERLGPYSIIIAMTVTLILALLVLLVIYWVFLRGIEHESVQ